MHDITKASTIREDVQTVRKALGKDAMPSLKWKKGDVVLCIKHRKGIKPTLEEEIVDTLKSRKFDEFVYARVLSDVDSDRVIIELKRK